jgi:hypothetical protein
MVPPWKTQIERCFFYPFENFMSECLSMLEEFKIRNLSVAKSFVQSFLIFMDQLMMGTSSNV